MNANILTQALTKALESGCRRVVNVVLYSGYPLVNRIPTYDEALEIIDLYLREDFDDLFGEVRDWFVPESEGQDPVWQRLKAAGMVNESEVQRMLGNNQDELNILQQIEDAGKISQISEKAYIRTLEYKVELDDLIHDLFEPCQTLGFEVPELRQMVEDLYWEEVVKAKESRQTFRDYNRVINEADALAVVLADPKDYPDDCNLTF